MTVKKQFKDSLNRLLNSKASTPIDESLILKCSENPYFAARFMWDDLYGDVVIRLENAYRIIAVLSTVIVIAMISFVVIAGQSRVKPYLTVLHDNAVLSVTERETKAFDTFKPKLAQLFVKQFLTAARTISVDNTINQANRLKAYALTRGAAAKQLEKFFTSRPPEKIARQQIYSTQLISLLVRSQNTFEIRWREVVRDVKSGELMESLPYSAQITFAFDTPSTNPLIAKQNPMGFYIEQIIWAKDVN